MLPRCARISGRWAAGLRARSSRWRTRERRVGLARVRLDTSGSLQRMRQLEAAEQRALDHFPSVLDLRYAATFAPLSCVDRQVARTVNVLQEFTQRRFKAGRGNANAYPFTSVWRTSVPPRGVTTRFKRKLGDDQRPLPARSSAASRS